MTSVYGAGWGQITGFRMLVDESIPGVTPYDFMFLADGFQSADWREYERIVRAAFERWREESPMSDLNISVRVFSLNCESTQHGCSQDGSRLPSVNKYTLFGFEPDGGPDGNAVNNAVLAYSALYGITPACAPVIVNRSGGWGRCGGINGIPIPIFSPYQEGGVFDGFDTWMHEWGHAAGLGDEYPGNPGATYAGGEPASPNVTANTNRATVKWLSLVTNPVSPWPSLTNPTATALASPDPYPPRGVGLYEGGGYYFKGLFRPAYNCKMREEFERWCPVCQAHIRTVLAPYCAPFA